MICGVDVIFENHDASISRSWLSPFWTPAVSISIYHMHTNLRRLKLQVYFSCIYYSFTFSTSNNKPQSNIKSIRPIYMTNKSPTHKATEQRSHTYHQLNHFPAVSVVLQVTLILYVCTYNKNHSTSEMAIPWLGTWLLSRLTI